MSECIYKLLNYIKMQKILKLFSNYNYKCFFLFMLIFALLGIYINNISKNSFPYFFELLYILEIICFFTYYTTTQIVELDKKINVHMAGDNILLILKLKYFKLKRNNIIFIPMLFFGVLVPLSAFNLMEIELDLALIIFCFTGLGFVVTLCTLGAIQYFLLLLFVKSIRLKIKKIKKYEVINPEKTKWFEELVKVLQLCNNSFLVVGLLYIVAFCIFCFSNKYGINVLKFSTRFYLSFFWIIIFVFIIIGTIFFTVSGNNEINKIITNLYNIQQKKLKQEYKFQTDTVIKNLYAVQIFLLNENRNKIFFKNNLISYLLFIINSLASVQATFSLINLFVNSSLPALFL